MASPDGTPTDAAGRRLPDSVVSELLADEQRRAVLSCLAANDGAVAVEDLARAVAARERGVEESAVDPETVRNRRDDLFQQHLPKLTPTGVVAYDSLLGTVALDTTDERLLSELE
jgi:hypothetical protein